MDTQHSNVESALRMGVYLLFVFALSACNKASDQQQEFHAPNMESASPWQHTQFDEGADKFTFAIFSDLTGGERDGVFRVAIEQLNLLRPEFVMSVGDLIEGGSTDREILIAEWTSFRERANQSLAPVFRVGGNHDLTNSIMREVWEERFGKRFYHFRYKDVLFLALDSEDYNSDRLQIIYEARSQAIKIAEADGWDAFGKTEYAKMPEQRHGEISADQAAYFTQVIAENSDVRWTFLFVHKPVWERNEQNPFFEVEAALATQPYTVFHGHIHAYKHIERHGRDYIRLATTGGVQFAHKALSIDHIAMVTVDDAGVDIANIRLSGIFDKTGKIPLNGESLCFDIRNCAN